MSYAAANTRRLRLGQLDDLSSLLEGASSSSSGDLLASGGGLAADAIVPGSGSIVAPVISSLEQIFGGNPATGANAERQAHMYSLYEDAQTQPGSPSSIDAVVNLYTTATQQFDPLDNVQQNNPQATRTYAQQVLQILASQGWQNVNSLNPKYVGVLATGQVFTPNSATGQEQATAVRPTPGTFASTLSSLITPTTLVVAGVIGVIVLVVSHSAGGTAPRYVAVPAPAPAPNPRRWRMPMPRYNPPAYRRRAA